MGFALRAATTDDGPSVRELVFAILRAYGITPEPAGLDAGVMLVGTRESGALLEPVATKEDGARIVGIGVLMPREPGVGWVSKLFVDAEERRQGIGRALLTAVVDGARARGLVRLGLQTRTIFREAVALYEATGWTRGDDPTHAHGPDRTYWLDLAR